MSDFEIEDENGEWELVLEVKREHDHRRYQRRLKAFLEGRLPFGHFGYRQAELALRAGYGFAYVHTGGSDPLLDMLRAEVGRSLEEALVMREVARRVFPDWQRMRLHQKERLSHLLVPRLCQKKVAAAQAG
jgi:hypothetical protein